MPADKIHDRRIFPSGYVLARVGRPVDVLYLICSGRVKLRTATGRREVIVGPGTIVGLADIVDGQERPRFHVHAETIGPVDAICLGGLETAAELAALSPKMRLMLTAMLRVGVHWIQASERSDQEKEDIIRRAEQSLGVVMDPGRPSAAAKESDMRVDRGFGFLP